MKQVLKYLCVIICITFTYPACKKNSDNFPPVIDQLEFSFTYIGQTYSGMNFCELPLDGGSRLEGVIINKEDIFGGKIYYYSNAFNPANPFNNCAFLQPAGTLITRNLPGCILTNNNGSPIDSSRVFIYKSGSINTTYSNCMHKIDPYTNFGYDECTVTGTFSLMIGNNSGQTKNITGSFKFINIRR